MSVFVDTSYLYALLDEDDANHRAAATSWSRAVDAEHLLSHAYVVVETTALVQRRLGMAAAARLHGHLLPVITVVAVDHATYGRAVQRWIAADTRALSLVDVTSFVLMADRGTGAVLAFDRDFELAGFRRWS